MRLEDLSGKVALVTGGGRGIGWHIAAALAEAGANVVIAGRDEDTLKTAREKLGGVPAYVYDQRDPGSVADMARSVQNDAGAVDILVNNAAAMRAGPVVELSLEDWNAVIETNLTGVFTTTKAFLPGMIEKGRGDIFMVSSMSGKKGDPGVAAYNASKFGLQGFSQALAYEVRGHNIRVMVLNPSSVDKGPDDKPAFGEGVHLHAADLGATVVHLARLPGRTLVRDMDIWSTNP